MKNRRQSLATTMRASCASNRPGQGPDWSGRMCNAQSLANAESSWHNVRISRSQNGMLPENKTSKYKENRTPAVSHFPVGCHGLSHARSKRRQAIDTYSVLSFSNSSLKQKLFMTCAGGLGCSHWSTDQASTWLNSIAHRCAFQA